MPAPRVARHEDVKRLIWRDEHGRAPGLAVVPGDDWSGDRRGGTGFSIGARSAAARWPSVYARPTVIVTRP